jgi:hypothetical protein
MAQAVLVTIEAGAGEVDPLPVVTLGGDGESFRRSVRLDWPAGRSRPATRCA